MGPGVEPSFAVIHELVAGELRSTYLFPKELFLRVFDGRDPALCTKAELEGALSERVGVWAEEERLPAALRSAWFVGPGPITGEASGIGAGPDGGRLERKTGPWSFVQLRLSHRLPPDFRSLRLRFDIPESYVEHDDVPELRRTLPQHVFPLLAGEARHELRFTPDETEVLFHRPELAAQTSEPPVRAPAPAQEWLVPTTLAGALLLVVLFALRIQPRHRPLAATLGLLLSAWLFVSLNRGSLSRSRPVPAEAARPIFEPLLLGVYEAFAQPTEGAIYDALAQVVEGPLLERLYRDVYRSLIRREHAGALSTVRSVSLIELTAETAPTSPRREALAVRATWQVEGRIEHFGHIHDRTLRYRGRFLVARSADGRLRIFEAELEEEEAGPPAP